MKKYFTLGLMVLAMACSKETTEPFEPEKPNVITVPVLAGNINLAAPKAGQKSMYLQYSTQCEDLNGLFEFTGDTLMVEVLEENGQLLLKEELTEHSTSILNGAQYEPIIYPITCDGKKMLIPERQQSFLFFFYGNDTLRLETPLDVDLTQRDCKLFDQDDVFTGDDIGYLKSFVVGPVVQKDKIAVSCVPIISIDAYLIYDEQQMHVSHVLYTSNFMGNISQSIQGWVLVN